MEVNQHMQPLVFQPLPARTARAARSVFNIENLYLAVGDQLDSFLDGLDVDDLDAFGEKPPSTLIILAMVTLFQFAENIPDRQAADAVRTRLDWKYALHLPLDYPGIDRLALSEFRRRLKLNPAGQLVFERMLARLAAFGLLGGRDKRRTDAAEVLATIDALSRVAEVIETMSLALEALASRQPEWLRAISLPHWYERYGQLLSSQHLPGSGQELDATARAVGTDIAYLLKSIAKADVPDLTLLPEVQSLQRIC